MPFLNAQIEIINSKLKANCLSDSRFGNGRFGGIAIDVLREKEGSNIIAPATLTANYEAEYIGVDDTYPVVLYHKILNSAYQVEQTSIGNGNNSMKQLTGMKLVVYGKRSAIQMNHYDLAALLEANFPDVIPTNLISPYKLDKMTVTLLTTNMNAIQVFGEEYKGVDFPLGPEDILFSMNYSIETRYRKGCFTTTDCTS